MSPLLTPPWSPIGLASDDGNINDLPWEVLLDASQESYGDSDPVTVFNDQSGNGFDFTPTSGPATPVFRTTGLGGAPSVDFNPTFLMARTGGGTLTMSAQSSGALVCDSSTNNFQAYIGSSSPFVNWGIRSATGINFEWAGDSGGNLITIEASASAGPHLIMWELDGAATSVKVYFDGALIVDDTNDRSYAGLTTTFANIRAVNDVGLVGVALDTLFSAAQRATVEQYAVDTWGVVLP